MIKIILILLLILVGCSTREVYYFNNTIETIRDTNCTPCPDCVCPECKEPKECKPIECDVSTWQSELQRERLQNARLIAEVDYYKNLSISNIMNDTANKCKINLTDCIDRESMLKDKLDKINESMN